MTYALAQIGSGGATMDGWLALLTRVGAIGAGLTAGVFFIFSVAIMPALDRLSPGNGMAAMQQINIVIQNALFLLLFVGTGLVGAGLAVSSVWTWDEPGAALRLGGGALFVLGGIVLTAVYHIPRNDALDKVAVTSPDAAAMWATYLREWVPWNHVRTVATVASAVMLTIAATAD